MSEKTTLPTEAEMDEVLGKPGPAIEVDTASIAACVEASRQEARSQTTRTDADYAIEFGRYLATAARQFMVEQNRAAADGREPCADYWRALDSAIYEFCKRANRATGKSA